MDRSGMIDTGEPQRPIGEILRDVLGDVQDVIQAEVRLAKAEVTETARRAGNIGGMFGGAAICGLFAGACLVATCVAALSLAMPIWLAALLTAILLAGTAGTLYTRARGRWRRIPPVAERTLETLKDNVAWVKHRKF